MKSFTLGALAVMMTLSMSPVYAKAKRVNGFQKVGNSYYYYKKKKKVTGLQKISGQTYYFAKNGKMASGMQTIGKKVYYFKKDKNGKAPLQKGKIFYSVGNKKGNAAILETLVKSSYKNTNSREKNLKIAYDYLMKKMSYGGWSFEPSYKNGWYNNVADELVNDNNYQGKCWDYAAMTTLAAKAVGYNRNGYSVYAINGKQNLEQTDLTTHAYTIVHDNKANKDYILDGVFDDRGGHYNPQTAQYFMQEYVNVSDNFYRLARETNVPVDVNGHYVLPTENTDVNSFVYQELGRHK